MKKRLLSLLLASTMLFMGACGSDAKKDDKAVKAETQMHEVNTAELNMIDDKYRNFYEVFVYSFCDSDGDGIGDIQGLISKLDYINDGDPTTDTDLGFTGIWLMPIMPSTTYHKYDVINYKDIDKQYGTLEDFEQLIDECNKRGINVIIDLVLNHSSSQHPWFKEATNYLKTLGDGEPSVEDCKYFDYYHFQKESGKGFHKISGTDWYYEGSFWEGMPDLNWENGIIKKEFEDIAEFWIGGRKKGRKQKREERKKYQSIEVELLALKTQFLKVLESTLEFSKEGKV